MAAYLCSPRSHWFRDLTDDERTRMICCAPNPWVTQPAKTVTLGVLPPERSLPDSDVDRIARRVVELLGERDK